MFNFQKRGDASTTASGLEGNAEAPTEGATVPHGAASEPLTMPVDDAPSSAYTTEQQHHQQEGQPLAHGGDDHRGYAPDAHGHDADGYPRGDRDDAYEYDDEEEEEGDGGHGAYSQRGHGAGTYASESGGDMTAYDPSGESAPPTDDPRHHAAAAAASGGDAQADREAEEDENAQLFTDYHGSADRVEARNRRLQQQKAYDDIPAPPDDADARDVFAYYRQLIGLQQFVPPKHWREIRFDLPANVAELRLYPQRRERIQDREPVRPSSTLVINLEGTLPENTTPSEYEGQMVQYVMDLLQYQNATSAITALRFVKRGTELSQMVVTLGRDARLASRVLTEVQAAGLRAHYGMIIFEHPPCATFQVVDYRRTLHDGKGISAEDVNYLLEPFRQTKTVDINVIEGYEPGVFYVPVKRPEVVYSFLWNYFCSYKFQADLFRRYGVLITQANCPHEFLKKGVPYFIQKRELEEKIKAELMRKGFEEREGAGDGPGRAGAGPADSSESELDDEAVASGEGPPPAWATNAADEIDIFGAGGGDEGGPGSAAPSAARMAGSGSGASTAAYAFNDDTDAPPQPRRGTALPASTAAAMTFVDEEGITDVDALLKAYNAVVEPPKKKAAVGAKKPAKEAPPATSILPPPTPAAEAPPFAADPRLHGADPRHPPPPGMAPSDTRGMPGYPPYAARPSDYSHGGPGGPAFAAGRGGAPSFPPYGRQPEPYGQPQPAYGGPPGRGLYAGGGGYPVPGASSPFSGAGFGPVDGLAPPPPPPPATAYPELVDEVEEEPLPGGPGYGQRMQRAQPQEGMPSADRSQPGSTAPQPSQASSAAPYESGGLLSWSMEAPQADARSGHPRFPVPPSQQHQQQRGVNSPTAANHHQLLQFSLSGESTSQPLRGDTILVPETVDSNGEALRSGSDVEVAMPNSGGGGAGILGDYDPSLDTPLFGTSTNNSAENVLLSMGSDSAYYSGSGFSPSQGFTQGWGGAGPYAPGGPFMGYSPQQQEMMMLQYMPPHVQEAAQLTIDLEERIQAAFPQSWAAASHPAVKPFPLDGEPDLDGEEAADSASDELCVWQHVPVQLAAADLPAPNTEMDELFQFVHRNVAFIGRLLHKTSTTTVEHANDVAPYRARVARALLLGATAPTAAEAWAAAWVPLKLNGDSSPILASESTETQPNQTGREAEGSASAEATAATDADAAEEKGDDDDEYQLPALLPYLLRMPAGMDLALLLAMHFPRAFARRLLPYAPACLLDESAVRLVVATVLRRDARPEAPLVRHLLAHWCPLLTWLKEFVSVKAATEHSAQQRQQEGSSATDDSKAELAAASAGAARQLVSLLGNTMDVVLAGLSPAQREWCHSCSATQQYVEAFMTALHGDADSADSTAASPVPRLWAADGALYRSLLRLYLAADGCDGLQLANAALPASGAIPRDLFYYCLSLLSRSQTAPALSREAAAFTGKFLQRIEAQHTKALAADASESAAAGLTEGDSQQLLKAALAALQTLEAYAALRDAYASDRGDVACFEGVAAQLNSAHPPSSAVLMGSTYAEWYANTNQEQRRNAEAAKVPSTFYYQPPSRRQNGPTRYVRATPAFAPLPQQQQQMFAPGVPPPPSGAGVEDGIIGGSPQPSWAQPAWATVNEPWSPQNAVVNNANNTNSSRGAAARHPAPQLAAQRWRSEWTETMRHYPSAGPPFAADSLTAGWSFTLSREKGRYCFTNTTGAASAAATSPEPTDSTVTAAADKKEESAEEGTPQPSDTAPATAETTTTTTTWKHPVDDKEYLATPQALLLATVENLHSVGAQICAAANAMHLEEAVASNLPPPAVITEADFQAWLADQRRRNVFLDIATMQQLGARYHDDDTSEGKNGGSANAGAKRGRDGAPLAVKVEMTKEEQQALLAKMITSGYPAVGAPYPSLYSGWSVYLNSAKGQYAFAGPKSQPHQPPLFIHPGTRRHYFVSPQAFAKQRNVTTEAIAKLAQVEAAEVTAWMADQRTRHAAIDAAVIKVIPIHYTGVEKALADNAAAPAVSEKATTAAEAPSPSAAETTSAARGRASEREHNARDTRRRSDSGDRSGRRRRRSRSESDYDSDSYSDDEAEGDRSRRRGNGGGGGRRRGGGGQRKRSPRRRGGGGRRRR